MIDLLADLGPQPDEVVVLTVILERPEESEEPELRHGSLLVAPSRCGEISWGRWYVEQGNRDLQVAPEAAPATFVYDRGAWLAGRAVLSLAEAAEWLEPLSSQGATEHGTANPSVTFAAAGEIPSFRAPLATPDAVLRVFPHTSTPAANLVSAAGRSVQTLLWRGTSRAELVLETPWDIDGLVLYAPTVAVLGINAPTDGVPSAGPPPFGLAVGRLEDRAWLGELRGDGKFESISIAVSWNRGLIDAADLFLDHEQYRDGDLANQVRLPFEDCDGFDQVRDAGSGSLDLDTLGRGLAHRVSLLTREGDVLDRIGPYHLLEQISISITADGGSTHTTKTGSPVAIPDFVGRLGRARQQREALQALLERGAGARLLTDATAARQRLCDELARARGEVLVYDRYFGQHIDEWQILASAPGLVRVLTGKIAEEPAPIPCNVTARDRPKAPMHERFYLWDEGGLTLGGSPSTFGNAPVGITRLSAAEARSRRQIFEDLWTCPLFQDVPRT